MDLTFDPAKDQANIAKHAVSLALAAQIDWSEVVSRPDTRHDYKELREIGFGLIDDRLYCVVFTQRGESSACVRQTREKFAMFKNRKIVMPSEEEEAAINRGIAADPDTYEVSREEIQEMRPLKNRGGRPKLNNPKEPVSLRLDADVLAAFRASGDGWQTRMNNALREWLSEHKEHA
jgi:uncharacterized protein (DUF4415 family)/uncharacterized DUF497 family protein